MQEPETSELEKWFGINMNDFVYSTFPLVVKSSHYFLDGATYKEQKTKQTNNQNNKNNNNELEYMVKFIVVSNC